ncbi:uncharacterized protein [Temnothorax longispinosus]|uniref:uncharacterized protein n=1 Tax=Temnothorax longispinosus TaxID=300112 RepID=UPI003A99290B
MSEEDRDLIEFATGLDSSDAYREWERRCEERLASLRERCREKTRPTYTGTLNSLIVRVARLEEARNALRQRFPQVGAGHGEPSTGFLWTEIETAFESHVLTGAVINSNYRDSYVIPVFFHNLSGYDAHFIIKDIANSFEGRIDLLPLTKESYISFTKNVYFVDGFDKLLVTELPPREDFYSSLTGETASESDYEHARNVWRCFCVRNLGEYSDLYLKTDVLLLADIFENFCDTCIDTYRLDPAHYYILPGYTWDAMLKYTGVRFELLTDIDMVMFVERGIRGGLSQCSNRYARANNKYMRLHDSSQPSTYLMYFDVNNLYGWAMCEPLPYADFQWVDDAESLDVMSVKLDSAIGYILEFDFAYPHELHDAHADLPFCPTRDKPPGKRCDKLLATLRDKSRYVLHYRNLQQCVRYGLCVTKIHRALRFAQSPWLRRYIELNTGFRARASNDFEKEMYKLMNNAVFGKTMKNVRDHVDVRLVTR